jgi:transposase InsO family protein
LTLLWVLGFWPVWVVGAVDYFGSRVVAFERIPSPNAREVVRVLEAAMQAHGVAERLLTDRGSIVTSDLFEAFCRGHGIQHALIRPAHPWTNGRIERLFRTFKETVRRCTWLFASTTHIDRYCRDFVTWYNRDRPQAAYAGLTPDEVFVSRRPQMQPLERVSYFDGRLRWWRFGPAG